MDIDWMWLFIGLLVGIFFGSTIRGAVSGLKAKTVG